jgi:hypothetical protein
MVLPEIQQLARELLHLVLLFRASGMLRVGSHDPAMIPGAFHR